MSLKLKGVNRFQSRVATFGNGQQIDQGTYPSRLKEDGFFVLEEGTYEITFDCDNVPSSVVLKEELTRNGAYLAGQPYRNYQGELAFLLVVSNGWLRLGPGAEIFQNIVESNSTIEPDSQPEPEKEKDNLELLVEQIVPPTTTQQPEQPVKRGPGRPRKNPL